MQRVVITNLSHPQKRPILAKYCVSFFCRLIGLTFRRRLSPEEGLLLVQSRDSRLDSAIHMIGVWIDLAVVWINSKQEVVDVRLAKSWRPAYIPKQPARYVLELSAERLDEFHPGEQVKIESV
jgi:uncharacterized membrane protein (UPF0127 family)